MNARRAVLLHRSLLLALALMYALTLYREQHPGVLSLDARQYQQIAWDVAGGFDIRFALQRLLVTAGNVAALLALSLVLIRSRLGEIALRASAPLLWLAIVCGATAPAYPDIQDSRTRVLEAMTCALWGGAVVFTGVFRCRGASGSEET